MGFMSWTSRAPLLSAIIACCFAIGGCARPEPEVAEPEPAQMQRVDRGPTSVKGELGGMNEYAVADTFERLQDPILDCVARGSTRVKELGGRFAISLRIDEEGKALWAYLSESTLGDRATERCVVDVARGATWPRPLGGEGLAQRSFDVDASVAPVEWEPEKVKSAMKHISREAARCKKGRRGRYVATAYVRPDGKVASAGVAPPSADKEEVADCVADALKGMRLRSPGRKSAKVTLEL